MHKGDTIPGLITAIFGYSAAIYTLLEDTMPVSYTHLRAHETS